MFAIHILLSWVSLAWSYLCVVDFGLRGVALGTPSGMSAPFQTRAWAFYWFSLRFSRVHKMVQVKRALGAYAVVKCRIKSRVHVACTCRSLFTLTMQLSHIQNDLTGRQWEGALHNEKQTLYI